jgi:hypothetical protein
MQDANHAYWSTVEGDVFLSACKNDEDEEALKINRFPKNQTSLTY